MNMEALLYFMLDLLQPDGNKQSYNYKFVPYTK